MLIRSNDTITIFERVHFLTVMCSDSDVGNTRLVLIVHLCTVCRWVPKSWINFIDNKYKSPANSVSSDDGVISLNMSRTLDHWITVLDRENVYGYVIKSVNPG